MNEPILSCWPMTTVEVIIRISFRFYTATIDWYRLLLHKQSLPGLSISTCAMVPSVHEHVNIFNSNTTFAAHEPL